MAKNYSPSKRVEQACQLIENLQNNLSAHTVDLDQFQKVAWDEISRIAKNYGITKEAVWSNISLHSDEENILVYIYFFILNHNNEKIKDYFENKLTTEKYRQDDQKYIDIFFKTH